MISFQDAKVLTLSYSNSFLGDVFRYQTKKNLSIQGFLYNSTNLSGVSGIWNNMEGFVGSATDYDQIVINGINMGAGKIDNISFSEGNDVRSKEYTASISIVDSGNLHNMTGLYYSGLNFFSNTSNPSFGLEKFSEDFNYEVSQDREYTYTRDISLQFISGAAIGSSSSPVKMARDFASGLFATNPPLSLLLDAGSTNTKKYYKEVYNQVTNECSFSETRILYPYSSGGYTLNYSQSLNIDQNGVASVSENGKILGIVEPLISAANSGYTNELPLTFGRANDLFNIYCAGHYPLKNTRIISSKKTNSFAGEIEYDVTYTNDQTLSGTYSWDYSQDISKSEACYFIIKENGKIKGLSNICSSTDLYGNALSGYATVSSGLNQRTSGYYNSTTLFSKPLKLISKSQSMNQIKGEIDYSSTYTDNLSSTRSGFKKVDYSVEYAEPIQVFSKYNLLGIGEIIQPAYNSSIGVKSISLTAIGERQTTLQQYKDLAKVIANENVPTSADSFLKDCQYSFSKPESSFNFSASWSYFEPAASI